MTAAEVLRRAAEAYRNGEIEWGRNWFRHPDTGCRCAGGALAFAVGGGEDDPTAASNASAIAMWALAYYLTDELGASRCYDDMNDDVMNVIETVGGWNDDPARTPEQVIAALEAASERAA